MSSHSDTPSVKTPLEFHRYDFAAFLAYSAYAACSVAVPVVLVQLARSLKFPLESGGLSAGGALHMGRTCAMIVLLLASGFIAGRFGKRITIAAAILLMAGGIFLSSLTPNYPVLFLALLIAGCGEGYIEAMGTPVVQDLHRTDTSRYMNFTHGFWSVGILVTVVLAGLALSLGVSWRIILASTALLAVVPAVLFLLPQPKEHAYPERREKLDVATVAGQARDVMRTPKFWLFFFAIFLAGGAEYCLTFWVASFLQLNVGADAFLGGLATAVFAGGMASGRMGWGVIVPQKHLRKLLAWSSFAGLAIGCVIPFLTPEFLSNRGLLYTLLFLALFLGGVATAPLWPSIQTYAVLRLPKKLDSTMIYVILSCAGVPGCGVFTLLMGILGDRLGGLGASFFLIPLCFLFCGILILAERSGGTGKEN